MPQDDFFEKDCAEEDWLSAPKPLSIDRKLERSLKNDNKRGFRIFLRVLALLFIFGGIGWFYLNQPGGGFPALKNGAYRGEIEGFFNKNAPLYVEQLGPEKKLLVWVLHEEWKPWMLASSGDGAPQDASAKPLQLKDPQGNVVSLSGEEVHPGEYAGTIYDQNSKASGVWRFTLFDETPAGGTEESSENERLWLLLKADLDEVERQLAASANKLPDIDKEIGRLQNFIEEKEGLKANADKKFSGEKLRAESLRQVLSEKEDSLEKLGKKVELAYRVTDMGKLVSLARETTEKESLWIRSMRGSSGEEETPEFREAYDKAKRIVGLKRQISEEQERIYLLLHPGEGPWGPENGEAE